MRAVGIILGLLTSVASAAEFTADLEINEGSRSTKGRIFVSGARYRMELVTPIGPNLVVIVDPAAGKGLVLVPRYGACVEVPLDDPRLTMNDPFLSMIEMENRFSCKSEGTEAIGPYDCTKDLIHYEDSPIARRWTCAKLGFPLKIVMVQQKNYCTQLLNIREEAVAAELFAAPAGYAAATWDAIREKMDADPEMKAKEEAYRATQPTTYRKSFGLTAGGEFRLLLGKVTEAEAEVRHLREEPCSWFLVPYADGKELVERAACTIEGAGRAAFLEGLEPDLLVAGATTGAASLDIRLTGRGMLVLAMSRTFFQKAGSGAGWTPQEGLTKITVTLTAEPEEGAEFRGARGTLQVSRREGESEQVEYDLAEGETKTWTFAGGDGGDNIDVTTLYGRLKVHVVEDTRPEGEQKPF